MLGRSIACLCALTDTGIGILFSVGHSEADQAVITAMREIEWSDKVHPSKLKNSFKSWIQKLGYDALAQIMSKEGCVKEGKQLEGKQLEGPGAGADNNEVSPLNGGEGEVKEPEVKDDLSTDAAGTEQNGKPAKSSKTSAKISKQQKDTKDSAGETKRKMDPIGETESKRGRGRPRKTPAETKTDAEAPPDSGVKRGRGRPRKIVTGDEPVPTKTESQGASVPKRGRGRPPKIDKSTIQPLNVENKDTKADRVEEEVDVM